MSAMFFLISCLPLQASPLFLKGYDKEIKGENIAYHSPNYEAKVALLVRSLEKEMCIEWETEAIPEDYEGEFATFVWIDAIDVNEDSHRFDMYVNGEKYFSFSNPLDHSRMSWILKSPQGAELTFNGVMIDKHDDLHCYTFLKVPLSKFPKGKPLRIRVVGESAGSRSWYMVFKYRAGEKVKFFPEQAVFLERGKPYQVLRVDIEHLSDSIKATVITRGMRSEAQLKLGLNSLRIKTPVVTSEEGILIEVRKGERIVVSEEVRMEPVKNRVVYLLHHSHVDIGYTHVQTDVRRIQWDNLEKAIEYARKSQDYPRESRFKWNVEVLWPVESYLRNRPPDKQKELLEAIQKGWIGLDGIFANTLTGLCRPEELMRLMENARNIGKMAGIRVDAAMVTDIPGYTWGLVPALAQNGINYLSLGTNTFHRIGSIITHLGDRPFYWLSPSGEERILCWVHGKGYSLFHTGLGYENLKIRLDERHVFEYLEELKKRDYPYEMAVLHYSIGSDNGPPDSYLSETVRKWNEKYVTPRIVISTTSDFFREFEKKYGSQIPEFRGDLTGYWEDGAASSARETAMNRRSAEKLVMAEALWTMASPEDYPSRDFYEAWRNVLLFDAHTWGSWNSISEPDSDFTKQQWAIKQRFALDGEEQSSELLKKPGRIEGIKNQDKVDVIDVFNTNSWTRTDLVTIPKDWELIGDRVSDQDGRPVLSQRLFSGELVILVRNIPAFASKRYYLKKKKALAEGRVTVERNRLSNGIVTVEIDERAGVIKSLRHKDIPRELVNRADGMGLNDYYYVYGRSPVNPLRSGKSTITVKENGPLVGSVRIESEAPGCHKLSREIRLIDGLDRVDIINIMDKKEIFDPEGVHLAFPFRIPGGTIHLDVAYGMYRPETEQIPGSCKNYFTVQRWVDVSNKDFGVTWATVDAPLVEIGEISTDAVAFGWKEHVEPSQTIYSYVMNNYQETNFKAAQEGQTVFRYSILPHKKFDPVVAEKFGIERNQSLIAVPRSRKEPVIRSMFTVEPDSVIVTSLKPCGDGRAVMVRFFNPSRQPQKIRINWEIFKPAAVYLSSPFEENSRKLAGPIDIPAFGIKTLKIEKKD